MNEQTGAEPDYIELTADIVSAYVSNNTVEAGQLGELIATVQTALRGATAPKAEPETFTPAVPIKRSITPDAIISLIDGKPYKSLKRHLSTNGLTPDEYRARYGLPKDYPLVAANYSAQRSSLAKSLGLGRGGRPGTSGAASTEAAAQPVAEAPKTRRRKAA